MGDRGHRAAQLLKQSGPKAPAAASTPKTAAAASTTKSSTTPAAKAPAASPTSKTAAAKSTAKPVATKTAAAPAASLQAVEGLIKDIEAGKVEAVRERLKKEKPNQSYVDPRDASVHFTPLIAAVSVGSLDIVSALLGAGADVAAVDNDRATALHCLAAAAPHKDAALIAEALLHSAPAAIASLDGQHRTPLHVAALHGNAAVLTALCSAPGAQLEAPHPPSGRTPLHAAAAALHLDCVDVLLAAGARLSPQDTLGHTPLMTLILSAHPREAVLLLLKGDCNVNAADYTHGHSALMLACSQDTPDLALVNQLLASGASPDAQDPASERTTAMSAILAKRVPLATALIRASRNIKLVTGRKESAMSLALASGEDCLVVAVLEASAPDVGPEALQLLGSSIRDRKDETAAALIRLVRPAQLDALELDVRRLLTQELPAAALALARRQHEGQGPDCALDAEGNGLLHIAAADPASSHALCSSLLRLGLSPNAPNKVDNATPLHVAARSGNVAACRALVEGGADPTKRNSKNRTPCNQPKIPDATREYLTGVEEEFKTRKEQSKADMFGAKIQATQTESAFGVRAL